jgi:hypothetical protein
VTHSNLSSTSIIIKILYTRNLHHSSKFNVTRMVKAKAQTLMQFFSTGSVRKILLGTPTPSRYWSINSRRLSRTKAGIYLTGPTSTTETWCISGSSVFASIGGMVSAFASRQGNLRRMRNGLHASRMCMTGTRIREDIWNDESKWV